MFGESWGTFPRSHIEIERWANSAVSLGDCECTGLILAHPC